MRFEEKTEEMGKKKKGGKGNDHYVNMTAWLGEREEKRERKKKEKKENVPYC